MIENAIRFLMELDQLNRPKALEQQKNAVNQKPAMMAGMHAYFSVGTVIEGIHNLSKRLFGISLEPVCVQPGEVWHPNVRRLDAVHESKGKLGTIYCDLFQRPAPFTKTPYPAQFTLRCSRRIDNDPHIAFLRSHYEDLEYLGVRREHGREYQLPVTVLSCSFQQPSATQPSLLTWNEVETLFHEFGHALHSILGRTEFQHVSGTRCQTDFVEMPSTLMEYFIRHPTILSDVATHYSTGKKPTEIECVKFIDQQRQTESVQMQQQIVYAMLDQMLHASHETGAKWIDSDRISVDVQKTYRLERPDRHLHTGFSHLFGYGAGYYSYLWSRSIARDVFESSFQPSLDGGEWDRLRERGECYEMEILRFGGSRDPWLMEWEKLIRQPRSIVYSKNKK
jgi:intermediate peptidase